MNCPTSDSSESAAKSLGRIAMFLPSLRVGGAEKAMVQLANNFSERGYPVDLLLVKKEGEFLQDVSQAINVIDFQSRRTLTALLPLISYLRRRRPAGLIASMVHCNIVALLAKSMTGVRTRILIRQENTMSQAARNAPTTRGRLIPWIAKTMYPKADAIIAVSNGVADDLSESFGIPRESIKQVYSLCSIPEVVESSKDQVNHPWFQPGSPPAIVSLGRLTPQKDYGTLLKAFRIVRSQREVKLVIIGKGSEQDSLKELAGQLGISDDVCLPGFVSNPFAYIARAGVFALSSQWEGLGLVLVEAMACGTTVVSTDCPNGPREVLDGGRYGILVPMGDPEALAEGINRALDSPFPKELLKKRAGEFSVDIISRKYLSMLFA